MKSRWMIPFVTFVFVANQVHAQTADPLRADLVKAGDAYLQNEMSAEDFIAKARDLKKSRELNDDERAYLSDIAEKMPPDLRVSVCPAMNEGLCGAQPVGFAAATLAEAGKPLDEQDSLEQPPLPPEPKLRDNSSNKMAWIVGVGLAVLLGAAAMKGKEIQIQLR